MPITNASPENILRYLHAAGTGTKEAMKSATSPRGILEWFVNFFTCGGVRRSNERWFREVIGKLTTSLLYVNKMLSSMVIKYFWRMSTGVLYVCHVEQHPKIRIPWSLLK
ncbi:effector protein PipB [Salmonella enterica subsp. enterica serovar Typhimurium]|nr:effector protein PipB [Salmonella enterica subsp. enterica serovar Typhimurium]